MIDNDLLGISNPYTKFLPNSSIDNDLIGNPTPQNLYAHYRLGLAQGCLLNHTDAPEFVRKFAQYNFDYLADNQEDGESIIFEDTKYYGMVKGAGKGKRVNNAVAYMKLDPTSGAGAQIGPDCTSWACRDAIDQLRGNRIVLDGQWEEWLAKGATLSYYIWRGSNGAGSDPIRLSAAAVKYGILLEQLYKTDKKSYDFTNYKKYYSFGANNGRYGLPEDLRVLAKPNRPGNYKIIATTEGLRDLMAAGGTVQCGSMLSFSDYGDPISPRTREGWNHSMNIYFYDDTREFYNDCVWGFNQSWGCYSDDTEVLTDQGWKLFRNLDRTELIYTLNPGNGEIELHKPIEYHEYDVDTHLLSFKCRGVDLLVTNNHNIYIGPKNNYDNLDKWGIYEADTITNKYFRMSKVGDWIGEEVAVHELSDGTIVDMNKWLEFLGYFLSEGHIVSTKKKYMLANGEVEECEVNQLGISQEKIENLDKIDKLLLSLPFSFTKVQNGWNSYHEGLKKELEVFGKCHEKYIPDYVWQCSQRQLKILFDALMLGDGTISGTKTTYYTSSKQLADDLSRLCLHVGLCGDVHSFDRTNTKNSKGYNYNHIEYSVGIITRDQRPCPADGWSPIYLPYNGKVYCITVPNHIMYVRRNGNAVWCGNSWNRVTNVPSAWNPLPQGAGFVNDKACQYALSDGGTTVFFDGTFFPAQAENRVI